MQPQALLGLQVAPAQIFDMTLVDAPSRGPLAHMQDDPMTRYAVTTSATRPEIPRNSNRGSIGRDGLRASGEALCVLVAASCSFRCTSSATSALSLPRGGRQGDRSKV